METIEKPLFKKEAKFKVAQYVCIADNLRAKCEKDNFISYSKMCTLLTMKKYDVCFKIKGRTPITSHLENKYIITNYRYHLDLVFPIIDNYNIVIEECNLEAYPKEFIINYEHF